MSFDDSKLSVRLLIAKEYPIDYAVEAKKRARRDLAARLMEDVIYKNQDKFIVVRLYEETKFVGGDMWSSADEYTARLSLSFAQEQHIMVIEPPRYDLMSFRVLSMTAFEEIKKRISLKIKKIFRK